MENENKELELSERQLTILDAIIAIISPQESRLAHVQFQNIQILT